MEETPAAIMNMVLNKLELHCIHGDIEYIEKNISRCENLIVSYETTISTLSVLQDTDRWNDDFPCGSVIDIIEYLTNEFAVLKMELEAEVTLLRKIHEDKELITNFKAVCQNTIENSNFKN